VPASTRATILPGVTIPEDELLRRLHAGYDAFNRGDYEAATEWVHPDVVLVSLSPGRTEHRGAEALRAWMEPDAFESQASEALETEISGNRALIRQRTKARGAGSGIEMEIGSWSVWTFDDQGRVTRIENYLEHEEDEARSAFERG
jgi:ketosteroid isomerase-like protein